MQRLPVALNTFSCDMRDRRRHSQFDELCKAIEQPLQAGQVPQIVATKVPEGFRVYARRGHLTLRQRPEHV